MNIQSKMPTTADEFLRWNEGREGKREFVRGRVVEMKDRQDVPCGHTFCSFEHSNERRAHNGESGGSTSKHKFEGRKEGRNKNSAEP